MRVSDFNKILEELKMHYLSIKYKDKVMRAKKKLRKVEETTEMRGQRNLVKK